MTLPVLTVYSRRGCHLCELLIEELLPLVRGLATVDVRDVDESGDLAARYGPRVPVVVADSRELCHYRLDRDAVLRALRS